jgi:hypothetical protein
MCIKNKHFSLKVDFVACSCIYAVNVAYGTFKFSFHNDWLRFLVYTNMVR